MLWNGKLQTIHPLCLSSPLNEFLCFVYLKWSRIRSLFFELFIYLIYLAVLGLSCGMWDLVPWPGIEPRPLHGERGVLAPGPPGSPHRLGLNCTAVLEGTGQSPWHDYKESQICSRSTGCPKCRSREGRLQAFAAPCKEEKAPALGKSTRPLLHSPGEAVEWCTVSSHMVFWGEMQTKPQLPLWPVPSICTTWFMLFLILS